MRWLVVTIVVLLAIGCKGSGGSATDAGDGALCGNGASDPGEVCDDGNTTGGDGCSDDCSSDESCGNQLADLDVGEVCDDGNAVGGDGCSEDCRSDETCGNGITDQVSGETCDDGNSVPMDGCSANCQSNETCGNGTTDPGEDCDSMNMATPTCDPDCTAVACGDGVRNPAADEACDDGDMDDNDGCVDCELARCGDGEIRTQGPAETLEQCDDGNGSNNDACLTSCNANVCHDGFHDFTDEECDDGNFDNSDSCVNECQGARCGDGHLWNGVEQCDDGATNPGDGCSPNCLIELMPQVYYVNDPALLVGVSDACGTGEYYDSCAGQQIGFTWYDASGFFPSSVTIELFRGIGCTGVDQAKNTYINGAYTGTFTLSDPGDACTCTPPHLYHAWNMSPGSYAVNGANTFVMDGSPSCTGFGYEGGIGGWARITVYP
jgi:cysteine-rich repeat protein